MGDWISDCDNDDLLFGNCISDGDNNDSLMLFHEIVQQELHKRLVDSARAAFFLGNLRLRYYHFA